MFERLITLTSKAILIPVFGSMLASMISIVFGIYEIVMTLVAPFLTVMGLEVLVKRSVINLVEAIDLFLLGTAFYLISIGFYELFVDENVVTPKWLEIHDLDDLKGKLLGVVVVVLAVQFLAQVLNWKGDNNNLPYGLSIALVIASLSYFLAAKPKKNGPKTGA